MKQNHEIEVGDVVCIKGLGTAAIVHKHRIVTRITKTMIITTDGSRHRRERNGRSVPYSAYGGTSISITCQQKEK